MNDTYSRTRPVETAMKFHPEKQDGILHGRLCHTCQQIDGQEDESAKVPLVVGHMF